jgi:2-amino-4-hydroxy-6-hydroxymethyldihydropteridine diphosphokinase
MILLGLGANLPSARFGPPRATLEAALEALTVRGVRVVRRSPWYESAPVPPSDQPWYVNGVAVLADAPGPADLLALLHAVERDFGRHRQTRNEARPLDLDLLAYGDEILSVAGLVVPHPRLHERAFVLAPLADVAPDWRHPALGLSVSALIEALPQPLEARRLQCSEKAG